MEKLELKNIKSVLLLGATGGIGHALLEHLLAENAKLEIYTISRHAINRHRVHNFVSESVNEESISTFLAPFPSLKFNLILNTIGYLENELGGPEKSLKDINETKLLEYFRINAILTPVIAKVVRNHLASEGFAFVSLSAMVGSIGENELGGWYGYRASKTALNAFLKNMSIESGGERIKNRWCSPSILARPKHL
jgi:NAD(P)-dependent dehydrogenase (short-subunit alcohol dehydrogenase family)